MTEIPLTPSKRWFGVFLCLAFVVAGSVSINIRQQQRLEAREAEYQTISAMYEEADRHRQEAKAHLIEAKALSEACLSFIKNSPLPTVFINGKGDVVFWNPAAERDTGYTFEEIKSLNQGVLPIVPPEMRDDHRKKREAAFANIGEYGKLKIVECDRLHKSGGRRRVVMTIVMFHGEDGDNYGMAQWVRKSRVDETRLPSAIQSHQSPREIRYALQRDES